MKYLLKLKIIVLIFSYIVINAVSAQDIQITVIAPPPHPILLSEFVAASDNYRVSIVNQNPNQDYNIILKGSLTSDNGIRAELNENYDNFQIISIPAASNQIFLFEEIGELFGDMSIDDINYSGGPDIDYLIQSQRLPDGVYRICLEARDFDSRELLSLPLEANCSNPIIIQSIAPPVITNPIEDETIEQVDPTLFNISWTPVVAASASIVYDLRIAEYDENVDPYTTIEDNNFLQFEETDLRSNVFIYSQAHTPLIPGRKYIVRVRARDENNSVNILNQGYSDVVIFNFGENIDPNDQNELPPQEGNFACMAPCATIELPNLPAIPSISIGDVFQMGHFQLEVGNFRQTINGYSGSGVIKSSDFIPRDINVNFQDVQINSRNMVTAGIVRGLRKAVAQSFPRVDELGQGSDVDEQMLDRIYDEILDPAAAMISEDINESLEELQGNLSLPISFGEGDYKIHIPDMTFTAEGAQVSLLTGYELEGDYAAGSQKLVFANENVCITPGGLSIKEEILKLELLTPYEFSPSEVFSMHINGSDGDNQSYIEIDCDGISEIALNGHLEFNQTYVKAVDNDGDVIGDKNLATSFRARFMNWDEIIFSMNENDLGAQGDLYFASSFEAQALPEFIFNFDQMIIDFSEDVNTENMSFPRGYGAPANWTGAFLKNIELQLPDYFDQDNNPILLDISELLIDNSGFSFDFRARNLEDLTDISLGGWGMKIDDLTLSVIRNDLEEARIVGDVDLPICENPIGIDGRIQKLNNKLDYDLKLDVNEDWEVPFWACKFKCSRQSRIIAQRGPDGFTIKALLSGALELNDEIANFDQIKINEIGFREMEISNSSPYFRPGRFDIDAVANAEFLGFAINIEDIEIGEIQKPGIMGNFPQLSFDTGFKFGGKGGNGMYLSADTKISITGKRNQAGDYVFDDIALNRIGIKCEVASVKLDGSLDIYDNHPIYGDGIGGEVDATFFSKLSIESQVLFGNVSNFDYWYVNAGLILPRPIPIVTPIDIVGFSGGAYYNMKQTIDDQAPVGEPSVTYVPRRDGWGLKAGVVWAMKEAHSMANGNVNLHIEFKRGGGLHLVTLDGMAKMMDDPSFSSSEMPATEMLLQGKITYNHSNPALNAIFGYKLDIPKNVGFINGGNLGTKNIAFDVEGIDNWRLTLGSPDPNGSLRNMLNIKLDAGCKIRGSYVGMQVGLSGYFNIGADIPPTPPLPPRAASILDEDFPYYSSTRTGVGTGIHAAFSIDDVGFDFDIFGLLFSAGAGIGLDASYAHYRGTLCNGDPNFGIGNWYFDSRAYLYADASLDGILFGRRKTLLEGSVGALLNAAGPNPFYARGRMVVSVKLPLIGRHSIGLGFSMGTRCEFTEDENVVDEFLNELTEMAILEDLTHLPEGNVSFDPRNREFVEAQFFTTPGLEKREDFYETTLRYKIAYSIDIQVRENGNWVLHKSKEDIHHLKVLGGLTRIDLNMGPDGERILSPGKEYKLVVSGALMYQIEFGVPFQYVLKPNGQKVRAVKTHVFSTTSLDELALDIESIMPEADRKHFHIGDAINEEGRILITSKNAKDFYDIGLRTDPNILLKVHFTEYLKDIHIPTGNTYINECIMPQNRLRLITFTMRDLKGDHKYLMDIYLYYDDREPQLLYSQQFSTSDYHTFAEKVNGFSTSPIRTASTSNNGPSYTIEFRGDEDVELPYEKMNLYYVSHRDKDGPTSWTRRRAAIENFARVKGFLNTIQFTNPEVIPLNANPPPPSGPPFLVGFPPRPFNLDPDLDPVVLKYNWRPNDYIVALRDHAVSHYYKEISLDPTLRDIFLTPYITMPDDMYDEVRLKIKSQTSPLEREFTFYYN